VSIDKQISQKKSQAKKSGPPFLQTKDRPLSFEYGGTLANQKT